MTGAQSRSTGQNLNPRITDWRQSTGTMILGEGERRALFCLFICFFVFNRASQCDFSTWRISPKQLQSHPLLSELLIQAIRVFFMLRSLSLQLRGEPETQLPLTREEDLIKTDDVLDLSELASEAQRLGGTRQADSHVTGRVGVRPAFCTAVDL